MWNIVSRDVSSAAYLIEPVGGLSELLLSSSLVSVLVLLLVMILVVSGVG